MPTVAPTEQTQQAHSGFTREHIDAAIASLQPVERVMIRLLMLQYLDPIYEDITFMAKERCEPNMAAGHRFGGVALGVDRAIVLPKEWVTAIELKVHQYASEVREHRKRLDLQIAFLTDYLKGLKTETEAIETLLVSNCEYSRESLDELRLQARQALISYSLRKLTARAEKQELEEDAYFKERLSLEYQAHHRRQERAKKRLAQVQQERQALMLSSLSDEHLATIWGIAKGPLMSRRVKAIQKYVHAIATTLNTPMQGGEYAAAVNAGVGGRLAGGSKNDGVGTQAVVMKEDLWSKTLMSLPPASPPAEPKQCDHGGAGKGLPIRLKSLASYLISEEDERTLWTLASQCLSCLVRLRSVQETSSAQEVDVLYNVKVRVTMPRKDEPEAPPVESAEEAAAQLADLQERLRPYVGTDVLPEGNARW